MTKKKISKMYVVCTAAAYPADTENSGRVNIEEVMGYIEEEIFGISSVIRSYRDSNPDGIESVLTDRDKQFQKEVSGSYCVYELQIKRVGYVREDGTYRSIKK